MAEHQVRVLLVDDEIVRLRLKAGLEDAGDVIVVGEAGTVGRGVAEVLRLKPDVTLMGLRLRDGSGVEACRQIREAAPESKVAILTARADEDALYAAIMAGAAGYMLKDLDARELHDAILIVAGGGSLLDPKLTAAILNQLVEDGGPDPTGDLFATLSPQENEIVRMIADGLSNREIAEHLSLSEKTIRNRVSRIFSKLNVHGRSKVAQIATEHRFRREQRRLD